jgi:uncharacterized membrane protein
VGVARERVSTGVVVCNVMSLVWADLQVGSDMTFTLQICVESPEVC